MAVTVHYSLSKILTANGNLRILRNNTTIWRILALKRLIVLLKDRLDIKGMLNHKIHSTDFSLMTRSVCTLYQEDKPESRDLVSSLEDNETEHVSAISEQSETSCYRERSGNDTRSAQKEGLYNIVQGVKEMSPSKEELERLDIFHCFCALGLMSRDEC